MVKRTITATTKSRPKATKAAWAGVLLDRPQSAKAIGRSIFNDSGREYKRDRQVWYCQECDARNQARKRS